MAKLTNEERETSFYQNMAEKDVWHVFTQDPAFIRKMQKAGALFVKGDEENGMFFELPTNMLSFRSAPKPPSEKQLAARAAGLAKAKAIREAQLASESETEALGAETQEELAQV